MVLLLEGVDLDGVTAVLLAVRPHRGARTVKQLLQLAHLTDGDGLVETV